MGETDDLEWDDIKDAANRAKHGLPLFFAAVMFDGRFRLERPSPKRVGDEERTEAIAEVEGRMLLCVYVWRGRKRRPISLRRAHRSERRAYQEAVGRGGPVPEDV
jgi:uncharacterized DUF497 family protein